MLNHLSLANVGPSPRMKIDFGSRLNLFTGDNGLGKSFILDVAWWALTRKWPHDLNARLTSGYRAHPTNPKESATITFELTGKKQRVNYTSTFDAREQSWLGVAGRPWNPGLVVYAHTDGGFSVWDPARNYWKKKGNVDAQDRLPGYVFSPGDVWDGLVVDVDGRPTKVCNGLIADWASWIREKGSTSRVMEAVLKALSPEDEPITATKLVRLSVDDARDIPALRTAYQESVPIVHSSAGIRRIIGLAYMLLWSWNEHVRAAELTGENPTHQVVLLFDELECHLHPRWQRTILGSLLDVAQTLHVEAQIQLIAATHSPLILASAESRFDETQDAWFDLDLERGNVVLRKRKFVPQGDVSNWLTSEAFDLQSPRSLKAERAIVDALAILREKSPTLKMIEQVDTKLREAVLPELDPFWVRWGKFVEEKRATMNGRSKKGA